MSSSYSCEQELRKIAEKLYEQASELEQAADTLRSLRDDEDATERLESAKRWAKDWMKRC